MEMKMKETLITTQSRSAINTPHDHDSKASANISTTKLLLLNASSSLCIMMMNIFYKIRTK